MKFADQISRYGRWELSLNPGTIADRVQIISPSGEVVSRPFFLHQPAKFEYDRHGYENLTAAGEKIPVTRFTPVMIGEHSWTVLSGDRQVAAGKFTCTQSDHPGYVKVSARDPRYFAFSDGGAFVPIGVNLCSVPFFSLPRGMEHFETGSDQATLGLREYERWFRLLSENGGNFTRIWLSTPYLHTEEDQAGVTDALQFNRVDGVIELARKYGIRLKLCFDHFRAFHSDNPTHRQWFCRRYIDPVSGREAASMDEWLTDERWRELWLDKVEAYLARYAGDPVVMAWELWNEMDCVEGSWDLVREWTRHMLARIKQAAPQHLVVQSLGSFDDVAKQKVQDDLRDMPEMDFQQVHRYLDQGAPWAICHDDVTAFSVQAVQAARREDKPILLAETGAVNDRHTGLFRYSRMDNRGIIFHDVTFPAFFAGSAATGQCWFWDSYVDVKNLWHQLAPFATMLEGVEADREQFKALDYSNDQAWCLVLLGSSHALVWARNRQDNWDKVLRDWQDPRWINTVSIPIKGQVVWWGSAWEEDNRAVRVTANADNLTIQNLHYGVFIRMKVS